MQAAQAHRRQRHDDSEQRGDEPTQEHAKEAVAAEVPPRDKRTDADEEELGEGQLAREASEGDDRQGDGGEHQRPHHAGLDVARHQLADDGHRGDETGAGDERPVQRGDGRFLTTDRPPGR